jgi:hypothetical protein
MKKTAIYIILFALFFLLFFFAANWGLQLAALFALICMVTFEPLISEKL